MALAIWTVLTILAMASLFGACVVVVVVGIRWLEKLLAKGRLRQPRP